jgi:hypothetical protein
MAGGVATAGFADADLAAGNASALAPARAGPENNRRNHWYMFHPSLCAT